MDKKYIERPAPMSAEERRKSHIKASNKYNKANYKRLDTNLKPEDYEAITKYCNDNNISKAKFVTAACRYIINNGIKLE